MGGCNPGSGVHLMNDVKFQSPAASMGGCNVGAPEVQAEENLFQSPAASMGGCNARGLSFPPQYLGFNPQPPQWAAATVPERVGGRAAAVSIPSRLNGRLQRPR